MNAGAESAIGLMLTVQMCRKLADASCAGVWTASTTPAAHAVPTTATAAAATTNTCLIMCTFPEIKVQELFSMLHGAELTSHDSSRKEAKEAKRDARPMR